VKTLNLAFPLARAAQQRVRAAKHQQQAWLAAGASKVSGRGVECRKGFCCYCGSLIFLLFFRAADNGFL
jgi:hypothetical protein